MKKHPKSSPTKFIALSLGLAVAGLSQSAQAASATWTGATSDVWQLNGNWTAAFPNAAANNVATFGDTTGGFTTIDVGSGINVLRVSFSTTTASYTIGKGGIGAQTLTLSRTNGGDVIAMNATTTNQVIDANLTWSNTQAATAPNTGGNNFINMGTSGATLTINGNITQAGGATGTHYLSTIGTNAAGMVILNGTLANGAGTNVMGIDQRSSGTLVLSGANTYTGATTVTAGTLALGAANRIADTSALVLSGGTFATGGFSETLNTLTLSSSSTLDFGSGTSALVFADSNGLSWTGTLTLLNFDIGTDSLSFTSSSGLTGTQLSQLSLAGFTATGLDSNGVVQFSAIPEPSTYAVLAGVLALGAVITRRRSR
ncbi:MAG TPA: autotransporter-associated beta strand repeat-containing protein [Roseimicrobium sp.]|nr:autotransporter-associated beta strand repeat-containing protein [Roseimicrobium sp.]